MAEFTIRSTLAAEPETLWHHAIQPDGVNRELWPLLRMTFPDGLESIVEGWRPGERLFRSWLLLGGLIPVEYDDVAFAEIDPGRRFLERSVLLSQRSWEHERTIEAAPGGATLTDRVCFDPRIRWLGPLQRALFERVFRLRHHNLKRIFGSPGG